MLATHLVAVQLNPKSWKTFVAWRKMDYEIKGKVSLRAKEVLHREHVFVKRKLYYLWTIWNHTTRCLDGGIICSRKLQITLVIISLLIEVPHLLCH